MTLETRPSAWRENLKSNWYIPFSAAAYFCLHVTLTPAFFLSLALAFVLWVVVCARLAPLRRMLREAQPGARICALLTALGICWSRQAALQAEWSVAPGVQALEARLPLALDLSLWVSLLGAVAAFAFVYVCVLALWRELTALLRDTEAFRDVKRWELAVYGLLFVLLCVLMGLCFARSSAFYGPEQKFDVLYTSDTGSLVRRNVYLWLTHPENDLRQPLFALFASPFLGLPCLLARLFALPAVYEAYLMNAAQCLMLLLANFLLARLLRLSPAARCGWMLLLTCTYAQLLFAVMMEQYVVAYFWLVLCVYELCRRGQVGRLALWGAGGTLLTGLVFLPFMSRRQPWKEPWAWVREMLRYGLEFLALLLLFCRFDVLLGLLTKVSALSGYAGGGVGLAGRFYQYTAFIAGCFAAPAAGMSRAPAGHLSWQLYPADGVSLAGLVLLALALLGAVLCRKKPGCLASAGWAAFSLLLLLGAGWGTAENGLILYGLYFGWAFALLLLRLAEKIVGGEKNPGRVALLCTVCALALLWVNLPAMGELLSFAATYYPA